MRPRELDLAHVANTQRRLSSALVCLCDQSPASRNFPLVPKTMDERGRTLLDRLVSPVLKHVLMTTKENKPIALNN